MLTVEMTTLTILRLLLIRVVSVTLLMVKAVSLLVFGALGDDLDVAPIVGEVGICGVYSWLFAFCRYERWVLQ